ncbi:Short chain dehydrogenase [Phytophthora cinnamomi]|uniref:Short chain dehydrogenase n=1 Tax=Phytophthora cinnamomi TaxID=4785 RepID=UPI00355A48ED|nr:Short chain dehydrogenase [Phytophthora cinnamomi]
MVQWMTVAQKFELIQKHRQNPSLSTRKLALWAHEAFNLPTGPTAATVSRVLKAADDIEDKQRHGVTRKGHGVSCPELDVALKAYVDQCVQSQVQLTRRLLVDRAREILLEIPNAPTLTLSDGWLTSFMRRHNMGLRPRSMQTDGEGGDAEIQVGPLVATRVQAPAAPRARKPSNSQRRARTPTQLGLVTAPTQSQQGPVPVYTGPKRTVLITGADSSTGVAFVNHYIREGWDVIAACPNLNACAELKEAAPWKLVEMDPGSKLSVDNTALQLKDVPIDLVVNNARLFKKGYMHSTTPEDCVKMYEVNALGPFIVSRALLQNLRLAVRDRGMAFVANISSRVGSISENVTGGSYGFRASMSALNMFTKSLVADLLPHKIGCLLIHSGIDDKPEVPHASADVQPEESVAGMAQVIARSRLGEPLQLRHFGNGDGIVW